MIAHAREEAPNECCGLLVGEGTVVDECVRARNIDANPARRYQLDPDTHIAANRRLRGTRRSVVGFYHSHPYSAPVPSATDREQAYYPEAIWIIVSLQRPDGDVAAYRLAGDIPTPLQIVSA
jgi:desampylase